MLKSLPEKAAVVDMFAAVIEDVSGMNIVSMGCTARPYAAQFRPCFIDFIIGNAARHASSFCFMKGRWLSKMFY